MQYGLSILLSGISLGGQYALIAIGYTLVYGILRLINFAHGDVFMAAGLIMVYLSASLPLPVALPLMVVLVVALGFFIERCAYKPLRSAPRMSVMISAIGVSYRQYLLHVNNPPAGSTATTTIAADAGVKGTVQWMTCNASGQVIHCTVPLTPASASSISSREMLWLSSWSFRNISISNRGTSYLSSPCTNSPYWSCSMA